MTTDQDCSCGDCMAADLPVTPFEALRARHGMLLGEDDFRVVLGNPRGKQMLHSSWLHGAGVVWGYEVCRSGEGGLAVRPGLAVDGLGRELALDSTVTLDVRGWITREDERSGTSRPRGGHRNRTVRACLLAEFDCDATRPVPVPADPCDVTRTHDTASRILEGVRVHLMEGPCRSHLGDRAAYRRLRVLLGLSPAGPQDEAGQRADRARRVAAGRPEHERADILLHLARCLAAADAADLRPACQEGTDVPTRFPVLEPAAVVLACVEVDVLDADDGTTVEAVRIDECCRPVLLPTQVLGELLIRVAAGLFDRPEQNGDHHDGGGDEADEGPRVYADEVEWDEHDRCYRLPVSGSLVAGSVRHAVSVTSLSDDGWQEEDVESARYDAEGRQIVVHLTARPVNDVVRLVVRGTGPAPVYGLEPAAPLAGIWGGPPAGRHDGHDAVVTMTGRRDEQEHGQEDQDQDEES